MIRLPSALCLALPLLLLSCSTHATGGGLAFGMPTPEGLDLHLPVPIDNPLTPVKVALGERLFFEPLLSADGKLSCSSCHKPEHVFGDTVAVSPGVYGRRGRRNAPSIVNAAYGESFFWDGRAATLEDQAPQPIQAPNEMGMSLDSVVRRLRGKREYRQRFAAAFADGEISALNLARAIASYVRTLRSGGSPLDRFFSGDSTALSPRARHGLRLFVGRARCSLCHSGPSLTDQSFHNTGVAWRDGKLDDFGRAVVTGTRDALGAFKTPSLRNVARTAPYMHDGSFATLEEVVEFYSDGGNSNPYQDPDIRPLDLNPSERSALLAFLRSLSGQVTVGEVRLPDTQH